ncbi:MAG: Hpt domain-containing protein [Lachnospiraceae bacterium]|nr:Hpt domain-containing protein [Lachnospiraceae bacterium]
MTVQACYEIMGGDYEDTFRRLRSDKSIVKFCKKFLTSTDYEKMLKLIEEEDYNAAFLASHSLKGMCLSLGLTTLFKANNILCEALRDGNPTFDLSDIISDVKKAYNLVVSTIEKMEEC